MTLWQTEPCSDWHAALDHYVDTIRAQRVNGLPEIDAWYRDDLPALIAARKPAYITPCQIHLFRV